MNLEFIKNHKAGVVAGVVILAVLLAMAWLTALSYQDNYSAPQTESYDYDSAMGGVSNAVAPQAYSTKSGAVQSGELTERKVVKSGSVSILVKNAEEAAKKIGETAEKMGGLVQSSDIYESSDDVKAGNITIRVPSSRFSEAMASIKSFAIKVDREIVGSQDITEQFIDLEARLKNAKAEEAQLVNLMNRAGKVEDILQVSNRLSYVRDIIERLQGQIKYLSEQVDLSTIAVSLTAESEVEILGIHWTPLLVLKQAVKDLLEGFADYVDAMIGLILFLPVLVLWLATIAVILILAWKILRWLRRKFFSSAS